MQATLRTNHFQADADGAPSRICRSSSTPRRVPLLPAPRPRFEIFVYSPRVEGVHLRGGSVARGGLRWSDRREDFRTEILGLMKAQMVKNAVIVPVGAKGGFVVKRPPADREALAGEVVACYRTFIRGLLDLTDNVVDGRVTPPPDVVRHDGDDPYLVVAADKGTATFSDIANAIAEEYGFWLGDAFASGGSAGYDHKEMGITARGAWESVRAPLPRAGHRHPTPRTSPSSGSATCRATCSATACCCRRTSGWSPRSTTATSSSTPIPDPARELRRAPAPVRAAALRRGPTTTASLISEGGGVWPRTAKSIDALRRRRARRSAIDADAADARRADPRDPARARSTCSGTAASAPTSRRPPRRNADVGDRANDAVRVDAAELRCRVVGEGGNLGFTQRGRVEYALAGGRINTDAIDNSAGVDCSDHEVNIKILLDAVVADGDLTLKQRNELLAEMTDEVARPGAARQLPADPGAQPRARPARRRMLDVHDRDDARASSRRAGSTGGWRRCPTARRSAERSAAQTGARRSPSSPCCWPTPRSASYAELLASDLPGGPAR